MIAAIITYAVLLGLLHRFEPENKLATPQSVAVVVLLPAITAYPVTQFLGLHYPVLSLIYGARIAIIVVVTFVLLRYMLCLSQRKSIAYSMAAIFVYLVLFAYSVIRFEASP